MAGILTIALLYEPDATNSSPVQIARVNDRTLATQVAQRAIQQAAYRAATISKSDEFLGEIGRAEANRLSNILSVLLPEVATPGPVALTSRTV